MHIGEIGVHIFRVHHIFKMLYFLVQLYMGKNYVIYGGLFLAYDSEYNTLKIFYTCTNS